MNTVQRLSSTLIPLGLHDVFSTNISSYLYTDHINNLYRTCKDMKEQVDRSGTYIYNKICLHYQPHSVDDLPYILDWDDSQRWYKDGELHRDGDLPAIIDSNGDLSWYKKGKLHREGDLPAIILLNGDQSWHKKGEMIYRL
jgi:hypothetical protein